MMSTCIDGQHDDDDGADRDDDDDANNESPCMCVMQTANSTKKSAQHTGRIHSILPPSKDCTDSGNHRKRFVRRRHAGTPPELLNTARVMETVKSYIKSLPSHQREGTMKTHQDLQEVNYWRSAQFEYVLPCTATDT